MRHRTKAALAATAVVFAAGGGTGAALAISGGDDVSVARPEADKAIAAALAIIGGGTANAVEHDTEKGATYEVEIRKPDGSTADVRLDANFERVAVDADTEDTPDGSVETDER